MDDFYRQKMYVSKYILGLFIDRQMDGWVDGWQSLYFHDIYNRK